MEENEKTPKKSVSVKERKWKIPKCGKWKKSNKLVKVVKTAGSLVKMIG